MSKKMNNVVRDLGSDISDSASESDEEMVEVDPVLLSDVAGMSKKAQGRMKKQDYLLLKSLNDTFKSTETVKNSKLKLKERFKAKSKKLKKIQQMLRDMEQSRDYWKKETEQRKLAEEALKVENDKRALTIKNLNTKLDQLKKDMDDTKKSFETKLKESESKYENFKRHSEEESKKLKHSNLQLTDKCGTLDRAIKDLEVNTDSLTAQISNLQGNLQRITEEKDQETVEKNKGLAREKQLEAKVADRDSTIDQLVTEELQRRMGCSTLNRILVQNKEHYKEVLKKNKVSDVSLAYIIPESSCSSPPKRSPLNGDGTETAGKKRKATPRNSGHVSEEEGEIVNQQQQLQQENTALATQPATAPNPVGPIVGALPLPPIQATRYVNNGNSVNVNARQLQATPHLATAMNAYRDNHRNADWNKQGGKVKRR